MTGSASMLYAVRLLRPMRKDFCASSMEKMAMLIEWRQKCMDRLRIPRHAGKTFRRTPATP